MQPRDRDPALLWDIREAARTIHGILEGMTFESFAAQRINLSATEQLLSVIGACARRLSAELRAKHPELAWAEMDAIASMPLLEYRSITAEMLWRAASTEVPRVIASLDLPAFAGLLNTEMETQ